MTRIELLIDLFEKRREFYAVDLRHLSDLDMIGNRLEDIILLLRSTPVKKRDSQNRRYRRLDTEKKLLETKREIYKRRQSGDKKKRSVFIENLLQSTSEKRFSQTPQEESDAIMRHNLVLMYILYSGHSDEELRVMINKSQS